MATGTDRTEPGCRGGRGGPCSCSAQGTQNPHCCGPGSGGRDPTRKSIALPPGEATEGSLDGQGGAEAVAGRTSGAGVKCPRGADGRCRSSRGLAGERDLRVARCWELDRRCRELDLRPRELDRRRRERDRRCRELDRRCRDADLDRVRRRLERLRDSRRLSRCLEPDLVRCRRLGDRDLERRRECDRYRDWERYRDCDRRGDGERRLDVDRRARCGGERCRERDRDRDLAAVLRSARTPGDGGRIISGFPIDLRVRTGGTGS